MAGYLTDFQETDLLLYIHCITKSVSLIEPFPLTWRSHCPLVTEKLCMHMMTLTHPTDISHHVWVKVSCCSPICSEDVMHLIYHLVDIHGFPPKTGHLGSSDKSSGINAVLTRCFLWPLWPCIHLITTAKLNSFSRKEN